MVLERRAGRERLELDAALGPLRAEGVAHAAGVLRLEGQRLQMHVFELRPARSGSQEALEQEERPATGGEAGAQCVDVQLNFRRLFC
eukprot:scaffold3836_cov125-Isochrysis_galbana.AAC.14